QLNVLDKRLADNPYLAGEEYSIADMLVWPWYGALVLNRVYDAAEFLEAESYTHVMRWAKAIDLRPAVQRGRIVNRTWGETFEQLRERHSAADFDQLG
ncbi:MAG: glutathione S-transferase C-terminal domain-containing protein, partial [Oceanospirillum sp.]|nr:glutathione S-transferase C-terminal domain-containing protein [Oceanospirillum sp.]